MIVIVTGGRHYNRRDVVWAALDLKYIQSPIDLLIEGECEYGGADRLAREWAIEREVPFLGVPMKRRTVGPSDGPERNERMARFARYLIEQQSAPMRGQDLLSLVHFPGGNGTASCIARFQKVMRDVTFPWEIVDGAALAATWGVT